MSVLTAMTPRCLHHPGNMQSHYLDATKPSLEVGTVFPVESRKRTKLSSTMTIVSLGSTGQEPREISDIFRLSFVHTWSPSCQNRLDSSCKWRAGSMMHHYIIDAAPLEILYRTAYFNYRVFKSCQP